MQRPFLAFAVAGSVACPVAAETPLTAQTFAAHVGTDTVHFASSTGKRGTATGLGSHSTAPMEMRETGRCPTPLACPVRGVGI